MVAVAGTDVAGTDVAGTDVVVMTGGPVSEGGRTGATHETDGATGDSLGPVETLVAEEGTTVGVWGGGLRMGLAESQTVTVEIEVTVMTPI